MMLNLAFEGMEVGLIVRNDLCGNILASNGIVFPVNQAIGDLEISSRMLSTSEGVTFRPPR